MAVVEERTFEQVWPNLSGRLTRVLQRRRVPDECVDDVVQETGLRLYRKWNHVDHETLWPLTLTIAGNIIKDDMRRRMRDEHYAESLTDNSYVDIEERAIARIELSKTHRAIESLNASQRTALLSEVYGFENTLSLSRGAVKMSRMRARRRLREAMGRASGLVALTGYRVRRALFGDPRVGFSEGASQTVAAALLIAAGLDLVLLGGGVFRTNAPTELGRVSSSAPFELRSEASDGNVTSLDGAGSSFLTASWSVGGDKTDAEEVIRHGGDVGPNGTQQSVGSNVLGQRATVDLEAKRTLSNCQGGIGGKREENPICIGTFTVGVALHHNGRTYGARVSSDGRVDVVHPWNLSTP